MRIAVINWTRRIAGGAEVYLRQILPALCDDGHQVAFVYEVDTPAERESIDLPDPGAAWCTSQSGVPQVLAKLSAWNPDLLFVHGLPRYDWLSEMARTVPTAFLCHDYSGICISGTKTFRILSKACTRPFGWQCLVHYYPCHCGGWNPVTMWREYERQSDRLAILRRGTIITASEAMRQAYLKNGFAPEHVYLARYPAPNASIIRSENLLPARPWRLLFAARMEWMKGGDVLLDALPMVYSALSQPLHVTFSGDGTCREQWERKAARMQERLGPERLRIEFNGWQTAEAVESILDQVHLLVIPSLWPEPFGIIGLEAGCHSVPAAAFNTGGIPEWLSNGVNGFMAPANPPTASGLADAIVRCLSNDRTYQRLRSSAAQVASRFSMAQHIQVLDSIFTGMLARRAA